MGAIEVIRVRRRKGAAALAGLAMMTVLTVGSGTASAATRDCGAIGFGSQTDSGVFDIRARGTSCRTARRVARAARPHSIVDGPYSYRARRFSCRGRYDDTGLPSVAWRCTRGTARVTFTRS